MSYLPFTLLAYFLNAVAVLIDKFMITKQIPNPLVYVFYFSVFSTVALLLLPFVALPPKEAFILASSSTVLWTCGAFFMFKALQIGQASRVIPIIGTLIPTFLLVYSLFNQLITQNQLFAILLLILGIVFLTLPDWKGKISKDEIIFVILSSVLFASSYIVLRQAYLLANFLTVLVYSRVVIIPAVLTVLAIPSLRAMIFSQSSKHPVYHLKSKIGLLFLFGGAAGGASELLLTYSISLATPALVNSLQGSQYVFLFIASILLSKKYTQVFSEHFTFLNLSSKILGIVTISTGLYLLALA